MSCRRIVAIFCRMNMRSTPGATVADSDRVTPDAFAVHSTYDLFLRRISPFQGVGGAIGGLGRADYQVPKG
jgi:hypothetical protein